MQAAEQVPDAGQQLLVGDPLLRWVAEHLALRGSSEAMATGAFPSRPVTTWNSSAAPRRSIAM